MKVKRVATGFLLKWFKHNGRDFVWRRKTDPYEVLMAEIMLQRTKAEQVEPVYLDFIRRFPNVQELNKATEADIARYFERLGLLWRATLVKRLAKELVDELNGEVPHNRDMLLSLPAVGEYIADAVLCFAYGEDVAVVDANVCRILGRVFGITPKREARRDRRLKSQAQRLVPSGRASEYNWAMIDLAALVCTPRNPKHDICPMKRICSFYQKLPLAVHDSQRDGQECEASL